jgi:catechol 2,3-dioxygenase
MSEFYEHMLGLNISSQTGNEISFSVNGKENHLLKLTGDKDASYNSEHHPGLYHIALIFPDRESLAKEFLHLFNKGLKFRGFSDHLVSEAIYLDDPEGNGIELYAESPEDGSWSLANGEYITTRADGSLSNGREPLNVNELFSLLREDNNLDQGIPPETRVGHVHLHVRDIEEAVDFYHGIIGFDVMGVAKAFRMAFVSAGGYHHHLGLNTWQGEGAPPPPADAAGLRYFTVELPNQEALDQVIARIGAAGIPSNQTEEGFLVHDPSQNGVMLIKRPNS